MKTPPEIEPEESVPGDEPGEQGRTLATRVTLAPLRLTSLKGKYNNLEIGGAYTRGTIPEGRNHLQGDTVFGGEFFDRQYYSKGPRTRVGLEASWAIGPASVAAEFASMSGTISAPSRPARSKRVCERSSNLRNRQNRHTPRSRNER